MGRPIRRKPVKLVAGFIFKDEDSLKRALRALEGRFGKADFQSPVFAFAHTDYYEKEFGPNLKKKFIAFGKLIDPQALSKIKIQTNKIERGLSKGGCRTINIDPGYLDLSKLVLASTKDYKHRVYLRDGIFAEVTLYYEDKTFKFWDWTYPDFRSNEYILIFNQIRNIYGQQIKNT